MPLLLEESATASRELIKKHIILLDFHPSHLRLHLLTQIGATNDRCAVLLAGQAEIGHGTGNDYLWEELFPQLAKGEVGSCLVR